MDYYIVVALLAIFFSGFAYFIIMPDIADEIKRYRK